MALSEAREWWWNRTGVYYASVGASDLPSFDAGQTFNPGDLVVSLNNTNGGPWAWVCTGGGLNPTWASAGGVVGQTNVRTTTSPYTVSPLDSYVIMSSAGAVTLPAASVYPIGDQLSIINKAATAVTVTAASGNIAGAAAVTLAQNAHTTVFSDGSNFWVVG